MFRKNVLHLIILLLIVHLSSAKAQLGTLFNGEQLLSSSFVQGVYHDKLGFIWVATDNGLNRYDGYSFLVFGQEDGLNCENVNCISESKTGDILAGTVDGVFLKVNGRFQELKDEASGNPIQSYVSSFYHTPKGEVWLTTSGVGLWQVVDNNTVRRIQLDSQNATFIKCVEIDKYGTLWVATEKKGIIAFRNIGNADKPHYKEVACLKPDHTAIYPSMCKDSNGDLYVGFLESGLYKIDVKAKTLSPVNAVCETGGPVGNKMMVNSLALRKDGKLFIGTNGNGLKVYDPATGLVRLSTISSGQVDMTRTKVVSIVHDNDNNMWLGLLQKGLFFSTPREKSFSALGMKQGQNSVVGQSCIMAVMRQKNGILWVAGDQDGLYKLDTNMQLLKHFQHSDNSNSVPATVLTIAEDNSGRVWVGSYTDGCGWIDAATGAYHRCSFSYGAAQSVFDIRVDYKGRIWVGTLGDGVKCYDPATEKLIEYRSDGSDKTLVNNYVLQMEMSADRKTLFVGTATGLSAVDIATGNWTKVFKKNGILLGSSISGLKHSPTSGLWVGTNKALYNVDLKTLNVKEYTTKQGLPNNHIAAVELENDNMLWISTHNGLCRLNIKTGDVNCYYSSDGTQGNEYSEGSSYYDVQRKMMFFGGTMGVSAFNPAQVKTQHKSSKIIITSLFAGGERVKSFMKSGNYSICEEAVSVATRFDFSHQDNNIRISFSTLSYSGVEHVVYYYRINGEEWNPLPPGENSLTLSKLSPGDYHFEVVANDNGVKSEVKEFDIVIHNAWYFTPLARLIYLLLIAFAIWTYIRSVKRHNEQKLTLQKHIHAEEMNEQKLQFFINVSHEIRTPMTLIVTPLMQLIKDDQDSTRQATYHVIKRNAERILNLVNQILDIRKIDKGLMQMRMENTDLVQFIDDVMTLFTSQAENRKVRLEFEHDDDELYAWIDKANFDKVLVNLLSNAFKYVNTGGNIKVKLVKNNSNVNITVFDNGEKISEENLERIFDRFYQSNNKANKSKAGTGVGLHLTRSIVELHHGRINVANVEKGVEFRVSIPLGDSHLTPDQKATTEEIRTKNELHEQLRPLEDVLNTNDAPAEEIDSIETSAEGEETGAEGEAKAAEQKVVSKRQLIVVVEDDDDIREFLEQQLASTYRVMSFTDGKQALPVILQEIPGLVISDVMMPNMDGYTLCSRVKTNVNTNHIPFILLTAKTLDEDKLEGLECGADLFVTKPFNMDVLKRSITNLINSRKVMQNKFTGREDLSEHIDDVEVESFDDKLIARIMTVVNENLGNSDLNIDMICNEVGISRVHLHRKMKELTNQTPHDFIRNLRMKQAARLLSRKGQSVTEVMYRCGFSSATSFSTMFKKMYGVSPREYMRQHAEEE